MPRGQDLGMGMRGDGLTGCSSTERAASVGEEAVICWVGRGWETSEGILETIVCGLVMGVDG
jgi:hypothetical protein